jgi:hypothetical protein
MRKSLTALTAATIAVAAVAAPTTADARWRGGWWGPAIGGFAPRFALLREAGVMI